MDSERDLLDHEDWGCVLMLAVPLSAKGVSLVEVIVALGIVALILALAMPGFSASLASLKVRTAAEKTLGAIQVARTEAVKRNVQVDFVIDSLQGAGWTVSLADGTVLTSYSGQEGSPNILLATTPGFGVVSFNNLGQRIAPVAAAGMVTLGFSNPSAGSCQTGGPVRCINVTVSIGGQARMCDPVLTVSDPTNPQAC